MKNTYLAALLCGAFLLPGMASQAQTIIPRPATYTAEAEGTFTFTSATQVACTSLPDSLKAEAERFVEAFNRASGLGITAAATATEGITCVQSDDDALADEGYRLSVTSTGITVEARTAAGFFYAFQSLKMLLPRNVMAEVADASVTAYSVPACTIADEPRFEYRGFMLDCSRHFFSVDELKRILDVMAYYKMNRFHWHLTDDQGWRFEMPAYPRLQTIGSTRQGSWNVDPVHGQYYTADEYGPYYYTVEQMKDIVAYAAERHIEVVPEIEMPGHMSAAIAAYPEFSCDPYASHPVWSSYGISTGVLNVANPDAIQFCKDVLDELIDIFPCEYIHIGGDECPTTDWSANDDCLALMDSLGITNVRALQSHFTHELVEYMAGKEDPAQRRRLIAWNESVTASGTDTELLSGDDLTIMCWTGAENASNVAEGLGMQTILTPQPQWYINRKQSPREGEVHNAGSGTDATLQVVYEHKPTIRSKTIGVQGTFWTEWVSSDWLLEYQSLPRLIAMAEVGWTQDNLRDFDDFLTRLRVDTTLLNYGGYAWCDYLVVEDELEGVDEEQYYRLATMATDARAGRVIELVCDDSPLISSLGATVGYLWSNDPITDENDTILKYQYWKFVADPDGSGKYAMVNKAWPEGSVNPTTVSGGTTTSDRWSYDYTTRHYNFSLGANGNSGTSGNYDYYAISSDQHSGYYFNSSLSGQYYAINIYNNPADGSSGLFTFQPEDEGDDEGDNEPAAYGTISDATVYRISNTSDYYEGIGLSDNGKTTLGYASDAWSNDAWTVSATESQDGVQTITLTNVTTGRSVSSVGSPTALGDAAANITATYDTEYGGFTLASSAGALLYPIGTRYCIDPGTLYADADATYPQGTHWNFTEVVRATYTARDTEGNLIGTYARSVEKGQPYTPEAPEIANYACTTDLATLEGTESATTDLAYELTYERTGYTATLRAADPNDILIARTDSTVATTDATAFAWTAPDLGEYYTFASADAANPLTLISDTVINLSYATDALPSFAEALDPVTEIVDGAYYLIYDNSNADDGDRCGYLSVHPTTHQVITAYTVEGTPAHVWQAVQNGTGFRLKSLDGLYIPSLPNGSAVTAGSSGDTFTFTLDGESWTIQGTNGRYFNGNSGSLTGWSSAHPYKLFTFRTAPYYSITYTVRRTANGTSYSSVGLGTYTFYVEAGADYTLECPVDAPSGFPYLLCDTEQTSGTMTGNLEVTYTYITQSLATGIDQVVNTEDGQQADGAWYDLSGRRVKSPSKGIYIQQGRKVALP